MTYQLQCGVNRDARDQPPISSGSDTTDLAKPLQIAEEFIRANIANPAVTADGLNVRALQRLFHKTHAATPIQVLLNSPLKQLAK